MRLYRVYIPIWTIKDRRCAHMRRSGLRVYIPIWTIKDRRMPVSKINAASFTLQYGRLKTEAVKTFLTQTMYFDETLFTFQYGRLKTQSLSSFSKLSVSFTFQYGRLKTRGCAQRGDCVLSFTFQYGRLKTVKLPFPLLNLF